MTTNVMSMSGAKSRLSSLPGLASLRRAVSPSAANKGTGSRVHPGDVVYWVACIGAACLLILAAT